jgi:septal ring factor EnvC (AmiA/AmiB activator)
VTWAGYWAPHLIDWTLGAVVTALVAWLFRKWILRALDARIDAVFGHAISADVSALHAAQDASSMRHEIAELERKLSTGEIDLAGLEHQLATARRSI